MTKTEKGWKLCSFWMLSLVVLDYIDSGFTQTSAPFLCQSSSDVSGQVYTPNIPDFYFNDINAADFRTGSGANLTDSASKFTTYFFTIPIESAVRNCSGTAVSIQYCYRARSNHIDRTRNVFILLSVDRNGLEFTINSKTTIQTTPQNSICTNPPGNIEQICCDTTSLSGFQIPSSEYTFGIVIIINGNRPQAFADSITEYRVEQFRAALGDTGPSEGSTVTLSEGNRLTDRSLLLIRFIIVPPDPVTTAEQTTELVSTEATTEMDTTQMSTEVSTTEVTTGVQESTQMSTDLATTQTSVNTTITTLMTASTKETTVPKTSSTEQFVTTSEVSATMIENTASTDTVVASSGNTMGETMDTSSRNLSNSSTTVTGAVVGVILGLIILLLIAVAVIGAVAIKRRQKTYKLSTNCENTMAFNNAIYDEIESKNGGPAINPHVYTKVKKKPLETECSEQSHTESAQPYELLMMEECRQDESNLPEEEDIYMVPGVDVDTLYSQLESTNVKTLAREYIGLSYILGSGQFGTVYRGVLKSDDEGEVEVAVKTLNEGSGEEDRVKFLQEATIMGQFKHPNVVNMYGVVTDGEPILIVLDLLLKGDLRQYLLNLRLPDEGGVNVDAHTLLNYCRQVASGMAYLSNKAFVHRDLAARNILVSEDGICKIADFGMSRDLMDGNYYISHGGKIPIKWTAPEALHYNKYSSASDVWSYGALMYEIWSVGCKPFKGLNNDQALKLIDTGFRLSPPPGCPRAIYSIMIACWHPKTSDRPSFTKIVKQLSPSDSMLLEWSDEDKSVHLEAAKLGANILCGEHLYTDLQQRYKTLGLLNSNDYEDVCY